MQELSWMAEYSVFAFMLGLSMVVGLYFGCVESKQNTVSEYLLGGKRMTVFPITMSLIASHISGITLLGIPSDVYTNGTQFLIIGVINVFIIAIIIYIYLPVFYELQLTSVYEYLERRFSSNVRGLTSIIFALSVILYIPVVIYVPALAFNQVTGLHIYLITPIICVICIIYTTVGGLKAVVWTDAIQSGFTGLSILFIIVLGLKQVGGFGNMIKANRETGRIEFFKMDPDPFLRHSFWTVSIGMSLAWLNNLGIHPGAVQRFVALPSYNKARKSLIYFILGMGVVTLMTGTIGMLMYTKYKDCDPVMANYIINDKNLLPYFVMDVAAEYPGLTGVFISGIVSAALSTMSAQLNTVSGTFYEDFIVRIMGIKVSDLTASIIMKFTVVITGIVCVALVLVVEKLNGILQLALSLNSVTNGAVLSVFTLGLCFPWANSRGAMCGMLVSLGTVSWIVLGAQTAIANKELQFAEKNVSIAGCPVDTIFKNHTDYSGMYRMNEDVYVSPNVWKMYTVSYLHYNTIGIVVGIFVGLAVSLLFPVDQNIDPKLLTPCIRNLVYPKYMMTSNRTSNNRSKQEEYSPVIQDTKL